MSKDSIIAIIKPWSEHKKNLSSIGKKNILSLRDKGLIKEILSPKRKSPKKVLKVLVIHDALEETNGINWMLNNWKKIEPTIVSSENYSWFHVFTEKYDIIIVGKKCISEEETEFNRLLRLLSQSKFLLAINPSSPQYQQQVKDAVSFFIKNDDRLFLQCLRNKYPDAVFGSISESQSPINFAYHCSGTKDIMNNKTCQTQFIIFMNSLIKAVQK